MEEELLDKVVDEQQSIIREKFGEAAAQTANYGWSVYEADWGVEVATKIYKANSILTSTVRQGKITHRLSTNL